MVEEHRAPDCGWPAVTESVAHSRGTSRGEASEKLLSCGEVQLRPRRARSECTPGLSRRLGRMENSRAEQLDS